MNFRNIFLSAGVFVALGAMFMTTRTLADDPRPEAIDTVVHPDGSKEHTLINAGRDNIRGNEDDMHWVLRIPEEIYSISYEDFKRKTNNGKLSPKFTFNRDLSIEFDTDVDNLGAVNISGPEEDTLGDFYMRITSTLKPYSGVITRGTMEQKAVENYQLSLDRHINWFCRKQTEVHPGVFLLRDPMEQEYLEMQEALSAEGDEKIYRRGCSRVKGERSQYGLYLTPDFPIGKGSCGSRSGTDSQPQSCMFSIWVEPGVVIVMRFKDDELENFIPIYWEMTKFFADHTVFEKSKNVNFTPK